MSTRRALVRVAPWVVDSVVAAVAATAGTLELHAAWGDLDVSGVAYVVLLAHTLPIAVRRRFPMTVLGVCAVTGALFPQAGVPPYVPGPLILLPIYTVASRYEPASSLMGLAAAELALLGVDLDVASRVLWGVILGAGWFLGHYVRTRRLYAAALERRAAELERAREELARRAVNEERLRIARELHDVVAHAMSLIAVQSGVGAHVIDTRPDEARKALAAIENASRSALEEMRRLLGVLREDGDGRSAELAPAPGLASIDQLVAQTQEAGVLVKLSREGAGSPLPAGLDLAAFRIVQEALTNVVKHARASHASVRIRSTDRDVCIEVTDDGMGRAPATADGGAAGHGIVGMRERAALYGGTVEAGPLPDGGFAVVARLPLGPSLGPTR
jgi:signal transduction histidine kinase